MGIGRFSATSEMSFGLLARRGDTGRARKGETGTAFPFTSRKIARSHASLKAMMARHERRSYVVELDAGGEFLPVEHFGWEPDWDIESGVLDDFGCQTYAELAALLDDENDDRPDIDEGAWGDVLELGCNSEEFVINDGFIVTTGDFYRTHERQL